MTTFQDIDVLVAEKSLLKHPFYVKWSKGELTLSDLRAYAKEYFRLVERIPGIVSRVRDRVTDGALQAQVARNVVEEQEHVDLWKRFSYSLGLTDADLAAHVAAPKTEAAIRSLETIAERNLQDGMVAMYAFESELPKVAQTKKDGLTAFYGLTSADAHVYFDEHLLEEKHIKVWRSQPLSGDAMTAADASLTAQNQVLDAVCEACGISTDC